MSEERNRDVSEMLLQFFQCSAKLQNHIIMYMAKIGCLSKVEKLQWHPYVEPDIFIWRTSFVATKAVNRLRRT